MKVLTHGAANAAIEIRLHGVTEVFDPFDPAPMARRALSDRVASYLVTRAADQAVKVPLRLLVHGPESLREHTATVTQGIQEHLRSAHARGQKQFAQRLQIGARTLGIGLAVLGTSFAIHSLLVGANPGAWAQGLGEGLLIFGWVTMWRPVEILLFEHR